MIAFEKKSPRILISATAMKITFMKKHPEASPGGGTPSLKVVGRLPGTHGLKSLWAPKKGGQNSMCCRRAKKIGVKSLYVVIKGGVNILWVTEKYRQWKLKWKKQGSKFYVAKAGRVKILWKLKYGGQNSFFFSWNPWSKFYVPWKGGSKFYIFSQCLEKGGSKPRSLPTNFTEGVPPPGGIGA